jgi:hypothetical protein
MSGAIARFTLNGKATWIDTSHVVAVEPNGELFSDVVTVNRTYTVEGNVDEVAPKAFNLPAEYVRSQLVSVYGESPCPACNGPLADMKDKAGKQCVTCGRSFGLRWLRDLAAAPWWLVNAQIAAEKDSWK